MSRPISGEAAAPPAPVRLDNPPLPGAPVSPEASAWQPPPAFTAAAAGMHVWPSPTSGASDNPPWPAATGEPVGESAWPEPDESARPGEPGDVAVWPPHLAAQGNTGEEEEGEDTVKVRLPAPAVPEGQAPAPEGRIAEPEWQTGTPAAQPPAPPASAAQFAQPSSQPPAPAARPPASTGRPPVPSAQPSAPAAQFPQPSSQPPASAAQFPQPSSQPPAPAAQPPASTAQFPDPAAPPAGWSSAPPPAAFPADILSQGPARPADPGVPPPSLGPVPGSFLADQPTPPGGIPVVSPPVPAPPGLPGDRSPVPRPPAPPTGHLPVPQPPAPPVGDRPPASFPPGAPGGRPPVSGPGGPAPDRTSLMPAPAAAPGPPGAPGVRPVRGKGATVLAAAAVAIVVGGIGTGVFLAYRSSDSGKTPDAATSAPITGAPSEEPASSPSEPSPANTTMLNSELTDPGKMTLSDAFSKKVTVGGTTFTRVKTHLTQDCDKAAAGAFATALRKEECRRVLRATYVDSTKKYAVTTGVAVLPTRESAVAADQAKNLERNLWFRGLPGTPGSGAERVHIAGGYAAGLVWGRYIVFSYATFADGHTPTAKEKGLGKVSGAFRDQTAKVVERRVTG
ncbi:hypothetical protein Plo01_22960 [Planobispora longispora]|uniref:Uncharacterized protein n=1 Tax=Planobispora longispora TaxID=28887 RepID=A0A8J3RL89_9ACTN|nr:hypothetical protein Plo01_22960 [Planobispora longispora]